MDYYAIEVTGLPLNTVWMQDLLNGNPGMTLDGINGKKGKLFSNITLEKFIREEYIHDRFDLTRTSGRSIRTFSSGEQKKLLLEYQLSKRPGFLVLDNPFDCLDVDSVTALRLRLTEIAGEIPVIQIFKRRSDLLPFITHIIRPDAHQEPRIVPLDDFQELEAQTDDRPDVLPIPSSPELFPALPEVLVSMHDLTVRYDNRKILNGIHWTVRKNEFWQLKGPNGSGKTTLLSMIFGDNPKAYGQDITLFGRKKGSGESVWEIKKKIGYFTPSLTELFQRRNTIEQMIVSGLTDSVGLYRKATAGQKSLAMEWLRLLGLEDRRSHPFLSLSQVHQRLVLIARAMIKHPPLLILDEPSTGLDDMSARKLTALINAFSAESETSIIYVSHRKEPGLDPKYLYTLSPTPDGSVGKPETL